MHFFSFLWPFVSFRAASVNIEEATRTVYLSVSRTNGLDLAVSVEWETVSETAFGMSTFSFSLRTKFYNQERLHV